MILFRYRFGVIVTHGDTPSIIVTLPVLTVPHRPSPFPTALRLKPQGRSGTIKDG
jgi:hypothetical protein